MLNVRLMIVTITFMCVAGLAGCGQSKPSASDGEKFIKDKITLISQGQIQLVSFEKTDGQSSEVMGVPLYRLEFTGEIEFLSDTPRFFYAPMKKGQHQKITGGIKFAKTENGWRESQAWVTGSDGYAYVSSQ